MQLKNKTQREEFLNNYKAWELWKEIPELELKLFRKGLSNGTVIIATEHACMKFIAFTKTEAKYKKSTSVKYHLLLSDKDNYKVQYEEYAYRVYNPTGDSKTAIINYLTATKPEV